MKKQINKSILEALNQASEKDTYKEDVKELTDQDTFSSKSPSVRGDDSVSGSTPAPESDDDILQNAHEMGIAPNADLEHPTELNLAKDFSDAEKYHKTH